MQQTPSAAARGILFYRMQFIKRSKYFECRYESISRLLFVPHCAVHVFRIIFRHGNPSCTVWNLHNIAVAAAGNIYYIENCQTLQQCLDCCCCRTLAALLSAA